MSDGSLLTTNYRYEIDLYGPQYYARRFCLQERLNAERRQDERVEENRRNLQFTKSSDWALNTEPKIVYNIKKRSRKLISREASLENKANIIVRRAALRRQLELDHRQYQDELHKQGKAFYFQRI